MMLLIRVCLWFKTRLHAAQGVFDTVHGRMGSEIWVGIIGACDGVC